MSYCDHTQATELADDGRQRVVGHTFQLVANPIRHCVVAQVPRLNVSLDQRHDPRSHLSHSSTCRGSEDSSLYTTVQPEGRNSNTLIHIHKQHQV